MLRFDRIHEWPRTAIFAHRGAGHAGKEATIHENTIDAFTAAIDLGIDGIELDIRRTADNNLVIHHDAAITGADRSISEMTCDELTSAASTQGYHVPTFDDVLQTCAGRISLDIELKEAGYESDVVAMTEKYYDFANVVFTSFTDSTVAAIKEINAGAVTGLLLGAAPAGGLTRMTETFPMRRLERTRADIVLPHWSLLYSNFLDRMRQADMPVIVWTVNSISRASKLAGKGVAAIISDIPEKMDW